MQVSKPRECDPTSRATDEESRSTTKHGTRANSTSSPTEGSEAPPSQDVGTGHPACHLYRVHKIAPGRRLNVLPARAHTPTFAGGLASRGPTPLCPHD